MGRNHLVADGHGSRGAEEPPPPPGPPVPDVGVRAGRTLPKTRTKTRSHSRMKPAVVRVLPQTRPENANETSFVRVRASRLGQTRMKLE